MSFLTSSVLWLLPLISIPLIFHFLKKRKFQNIPFSTLRFFNSIEKESINKINIINILLLIIRTLIILLIILMISRPIITGQYSTNKNDNNALVLILIDNSFSNKSTINNNLNQIINTISSSYNEKTYLKILRMSDNKIIFDKINDDNISLTNKIPISYSPILLENVINNINFDDFDDFHIRKDLYIISDLNESMLKEFNDKSLKKIEDFNRFFIKTPTNFDNIKITSVEIDKSFLLPNELFSVSCSIWNDYEDTNDLLVEFFIDDTNVGKHLLNIKNNTKKDIIFKSSLPDFGNYPCYIKMSSNDQIAEDNFFYFNLNLKDKSSIATIASNDSETYFISNALNAFNEFYNDQDLFKYSLDNYLTNNKNNFNSVIVFGFSNLNEAFLNKAKSQTNNIILFPTDKDFNSEYLGKLLKNAFLYQNSYKILNNDNFVSLDSNSIDKQYIKLFNENNKTIKIFKYLNFPISAETKLKQTNGTTFLYDYKYDNLSLNIFSTPLNLNSSNFPIKGSFLPFIKILTDKSSLKSYYFSNESIPYKNYQELTHILPNNKGYPLIKDVLNFNELGIHKITQGRKIIDYISINIHPDEHNSLSIKSDEIEKILPNSLIIEDSSMLQDFLKKMIIGVEIWIYLLYVIAILTIIEMYLSNFYYKE